MRAEKKLDKCNEDCRFNSSGLCAFGLRDNVGCYLDSDVRVTVGNILIDARIHNTKEAIQTLVKLSSLNNVDK